MNNIKGENIGVIWIIHLHSVLTTYFTIKCLKTFMYASRYSWMQIFRLYAFQMQITITNQILSVT